VIRLLLETLPGATGYGVSLFRSARAVRPSAVTAINGAVSDDGLYPSQTMKRQALGS
jgi:hypothetical protein